MYPIIHAQCKETDIKCKFTLENGVDVEIAKRIQEYLTNYPICK